jgi:hypothetical protein
LRNWRGSMSAFDPTTTKAKSRRCDSTLVSAIP